MTDIEKHIIENYSALLNSLSPSSKKELIENLSQSLQTKADVKEKEFYKAFGAFGSNKPAEEILADIRSGRKFRDKEIKL